MTNPFLKNAGQNSKSQQVAPGFAPMAPPTGNVNAFSAPPTAFQPSIQPFAPSGPMSTNIAPPPTTDNLVQQMSNMSFQSAPPTNAMAPPPSTNAMAPPPTNAVQGSYLATRGRYQVPSNAYQYASGSQPTQSQPSYNSEMGSQATPAFMGTASTNYSASAPAPAPVSPETLPDEEYVKLTYEVAPNSPSLQSLCSIPFGGIFRPMAADGVFSIVRIHV